MLLDSPAAPDAPIVLEYLNSYEAARHLDVSRPQFRLWCDTAGLPCHRTPSGGFLYERHALDAWKRAHDRRPTRRPARYGRHGEMSILVSETEAPARGLPEHHARRLAGREA